MGPETITGLPTSGRLRPATSADTQFFWDGAREHRLLIQRCGACGTLRHPPGPACPSCRSLEWDTVEASGLGTLHSYIVHHHPPIPGFDKPVLVGLADLDEGTRLVANIDAELDDIRIGQRLSVFFLDQSEGWSVPQFRIEQG
jgi:uncharacterized OB-fold protein